MRSDRICIGEGSINPNQPIDRQEFRRIVKTVLKETGFLEGDCEITFGQPNYFDGYAMKIWAKPLEGRKQGKAFWRENIGEGWGD